jgi:hypothetical protein
MSDSFLFEQIRSRLHMIYSVMFTITNKKSTVEYKSLLIKQVALFSTIATCFGLSLRQNPRLF